MTERMKKNEFARRMAEKMDTHEAVAEMWLDTMVETLYESLKAGKSVTITHLGSFYVSKRRPTWIFKFNPAQKLRALFG